MGEQSESGAGLKIYNSNLADVTVDMDDEGDWNARQSCYIRVTCRLVPIEQRPCFVLNLLA